MANSNSPNQYDTGGQCYYRSKSSTSLFCQIGRERGWEISDASENQDIYEHWDHKIQKTDGGVLHSYLVELKSQKKISRSDSKIQDEWVWIELHSVRKDDRGWLLDSKADFICFERNDCFEFYNRVDLIERVNQLVDFNTYANSSSDARNILYTRPGRPDIITLIEFDKISDLCKGRWPKRRNNG